MKKNRNSIKKGVFLLPNLLTSLGLFCGFYAIIATIKGDFHVAAIAIIIAAIFDGLDGRVARLTKTTSKFGLQYDSLSDLVAFGVAPGVLSFMWALQDYGRLGWLAAFLYVATTALRLARFNTLALTGASLNKNYFLGLPCPTAAGAIATAVLVFKNLGLTGQIHNPAILIMIYALSFLMVSNVRYYNFKDVRWFHRHPFTGLVVILLFMTIIAAQPAITLAVLAVTYISSGLANLIYRMFKPATTEQEKEKTVESVNK